MIQIPGISFSHAGRAPRRTPDHKGANRLGSKRHCIALLPALLEAVVLLANTSTGPRREILRREIVPTTWRATLVMTSDTKLNLSWVLAQSGTQTRGQDQLVLAKCDGELGYSNGG